MAARCILEFIYIKYSCKSERFVIYLAIIPGTVMHAVLQAHTFFNECMGIILLINHSQKPDSGLLFHITRKL